LASFIFNLGSTQFAGSTALKRLNAGDYEGCAEAMLWWCKPSEIMSRRRGEHQQFLNLAHVARA
jgi:lysozyme